MHKWPGSSSSPSNVDFWTFSKYMSTLPNHRSVIFQLHAEEGHFYQESTNVWKRVYSVYNSLTNGSIS